MKEKVLISKRIPQECLAPYLSEFDFTMPATDTPFTHQQILDYLPDFDGFFSIDVDADRQLFDTAKKMRVIANFGVGYDRIDWRYATEKGIPVLNTPTTVTEATAEHAVALIMATMRGIPRYDKQVRGHVWKAPLFGDENTMIAGSTLGIVGFGRIGKRVCRKCQGLGMKVEYYDKFRAKPEVEAEFGVTYRPFDELIAEADCVTLHCPFFPEDLHMFSAPVFAKMKRSAYFINAARGKLVDEAALCEALKDHVIKGAGLDVYEKEPNQVYPGLLELDNVVLTPHIASLTMRSRTDMANEGLGGLITALCGGRPSNCVNPTVFEKK